MGEQRWIKRDYPQKYKKSPYGKQDHAGCWDKSQILTENKNKNGAAGGT
jgi:hypothetical protein